MQRVFVAKFAVFFEFDSLGIVLLVLHVVVIALFALGAGKRDTGSVDSRHLYISFKCEHIEKISTPNAVLIYIITNETVVSTGFTRFNLFYKKALSRYLNQTQSFFKS